MDAETVRSMLEEQYEHAGTDTDRSHAMYRDDAVLEFPQSGERFVGLENFREWRREYPASVRFELRDVRGRDDVWVAEVSLAYDEGPAHFGVSIIELRDGKIARETIYVAEGFKPPEWRARWRADP
jgi:SnoaL-like domain